MARVLHLRFRLDAKVEKMNGKLTVSCATVVAADFGSEVLRSEQAVLVAFSAPWSRPCQVLDEALDQVAKACAGGLKIVKVNADDNPDLSLWYDVHSIPTLLCFAGGSLLARVVGTASPEAIIEKLKSSGAIP